MLNGVKERTFVRVQLKKKKNKKEREMKEKNI